MSAFNLALSAAVAAVCLSAQPLTGSSSLSGAVTDAVTGAPVRKVAVTIEMLRPVQARATAVTDAQGRWQLAGIPAGEYQVSISKSGYESMKWGTRGRGRPEATVSLQAGQAHGGIDFQMFPVSVVTGVVYGIDGEPSPNAQVQALQQRFPRGKPELRRAAFAATDDRGEYRLVLPGPGTFWVHASSPMAQYFPDQEGDAVPGQYYRDGAPITVEPGATISGADIRLMNVPGGTIKARISGVPEEARGRLRVELIPRQPFIGRGVGGRHRSEDRDGVYEIAGVAPGSYTVAVLHQGRERTLAALQDVEVSGGNTVELRLALQPLPEIQCVVSVEGPGAEAVKQVTVQLVRGDGLPSFRPPRASTTPGGPCVLKDVAPGVWDINVSPIPKGGYLKTMTLGGRDVLRQEMHISAGSSDPLKIVIGTQGASLSGKVKAGTPATILLAPEGEWSRVLSFYRTATADAAGGWRLEGATPGTYRVYAFEAVDDNAWRDPEFLKPFHPYSALVELAEGDNGTAEVTLIPAGASE